jgi:S-DNA-T family DNA segregation ATPase FtsK/SpoIIIE
VAKAKKRKKTTRKSKPKARAKSRKPSTLQRTLTGLTAERRIDIVGVSAALVGTLTVLAMISNTPGGVGEAWIIFLRRSFGWGVYLLPLGLIVLGLWLLLRNVEQVPPPKTQSATGAFLLFFNLLIWLHIFTFPVDVADARYLAEQGLGGGRAGLGLMLWLQGGLGTVGMVVLLFAWLLIALALTFDVSVVKLFDWTKPIFTQLRYRFQGMLGRDEDTPVYVSSPMETDAPTAEVVAAVKEPEIEIEGSSEEGESLVPEDEGERPAWTLPVLEDMLDSGDEMSYDDEVDKKRAAVIEETLRSFGAPASVVEINRGPTITQFGVEPDFVETRNGRTRVRVNKIASLSDDIALALAASRIRVEAPVPGKGFVGIEVPNEQESVVALRDVMVSDAFKRLKSPLRFALGQDVAGRAIAADLASMPHLLIAGATGSGKSVSVNALIACLLLNNTPETLRFIMVDPKRVELTGYNGIPHLLTPVIVDIERVVGFLQWVTHEMDKRYQKFAKVGVRHVKDFNKLQQEAGAESLPYLVVVIDELADLMMVAPDQTEKLITRMAQLARATGIHLVISTQRPSVDVVTGLIKANFPARISFAVASGTDSRVILDQPGAERLLGRGDMLFQPPDAPAPVRLQGVYLADSEILSIVNYWRAFGQTADNKQLAGDRPTDAAPAGVPLKQMPIWEEVKEIQEEEEKDVMFDEAVDLVRRKGRASISMLQQRLRIGYTRSARIVEMMEAKGIIGPPQGGAHHREILDYGGTVGPPVGE